MDDLTPAQVCRRDADEADSFAGRIEADAAQYQHTAEAHHVAGRAALADEAAHKATWNRGRADATRAAARHLRHLADRFTN